MEDKRVGDLPRATEPGDSDLMVMETASGRAQSLTVGQLRQAVTPAAALALVRQLLGKAVYTEDVTADLTALDALLGGGEPPDEPDVPVVPPDEPEVVTGSLKCGYILERYPDITTFVFTPKERTLYDCNAFVYPSTLGGGILSVDFDTTKCNGFQMMFFLFGPDGEPYKLGRGAGPKSDSSISTATGYPTVGDDLAGGMSTVDWSKDPGSSPGWTTVAGPFTLAIPDGCNIMIAVQGNGRISADGSVTSVSTLYDLWDSGWLTATITKEV